MLDKAPLGKKYTCFKCSCKFYDLKREEPLCPRCGADQREDPNPDPREAFLDKFRRPSSAPKAAPVAVSRPRHDGELEGEGEEFVDEDFGGDDIIDADVGDDDFEPDDDDDEEEPEKDED